MKLFFSVGEPSGDLHGANLIRAIKEKNPQAKCVGFGGPKMAAAGCELHENLTQYAVMWLWHAIKYYFRFKKFATEARAYFEKEKPNAVILIDFPGFNWHIAKHAKACGIPVYYYGVPQIWAWAGWRIHKMRRCVDHALCKLPFEEKWYRAKGCHAVYVGHPYFDELVGRELDPRFLSEFRQKYLFSGPEKVEGRGRRLITILPGSRNQEVKSNLATFLKAASLVQKKRPETVFAVAAYNVHQAQIAKELIEEKKVNVDVFTKKTAELIELADCTMACSGSVSLELLYHQKPSVILYQVSRFGFWIQRIMRKVQYITLVNLLASKNPLPGKLLPYDPDQYWQKKRGDPTYRPEVPFPEYLTAQEKSHSIAQFLLHWQNDRAVHNEIKEQLGQLKSKFGAAGASVRAAEYIVATLEAEKGNTSNSKANRGGTAAGVSQKQFPKSA
ncbi:MAG: lipid-A-disaccharide synthase [Pirellulaceae bacterium]|nr:lipid-A-disaccharide synthase [Pirellulaceae bacterium]